ncbi:hypothetical protein HZC21_01435 [Candidatus Peregrinibacteria bacterium]|nr:hypothetical protein [Candidatus Peregrinibacteria bacterium]
MAKLVNWNLFEQTLREKKMFVFTPLDVRRVLKVTSIAATFLLHRYAKKGFIARFKRGLYALKGVNIPDLYLANRLYEPSYISLEFALAYHQIIPETVYEITSITTKATRRFKAFSKIFTYHRIKREAFTGYRLERQNGFDFFIAEPEKAFCDLLYLQVISGSKLIERVRLDRLNFKKVFNFAATFQNTQFSEFITDFLK